MQKTNWNTSWWYPQWLSGVSSYFSFCWMWITAVRYEEIKGYQGEKSASATKSAQALVSARICTICCVWTVKEKNWFHFHGKFPSPQQSWTWVTTSWRTCHRTFSATVLTWFGCSWTTTSWGIYHQAFSATIPSWSGCKFGVFLKIGVRGTHGIQPSKQAFECVGDIAYSIHEKTLQRTFF